MFTLYNREQIDAAAERVCEIYNKTAPTVSDWADWIYSARDNEVTLSDLLWLQRLANEETPANYAANAVYHLMESRGQSTIGHAGF